MPEFKNPFSEHGYDPGLMDVAVKSLMRGRKGEGVAVHVVMEDNLISLSSDDRLTISHMVDHAVGVESARTVGYGILGLVQHRAG